MYLHWLYDFIPIFGERSDDNFAELPLMRIVRRPLEPSRNQILIRFLLLQSMCISANCKMYSSELANAFLKIAKGICMSWTVRQPGGLLWTGNQMWIRFLPLPTTKVFGKDRNGVVQKVKCIGQNSKMYLSSIYQLLLQPQKSPNGVPTIRTG